MNKDWEPESCLRFNQERTQPAIDLLIGFLIVEALQENRDGCPQSRLLWPNQEGTHKLSPKSCPGRPDVWVRRWCTITASFPSPTNSGMYSATGRLRPSRSFSTRIL